MEWVIDSSFLERSIVGVEVEPETTTVTAQRTPPKTQRADRHKVIGALALTWNAEHVGPPASLLELRTRWSEAVTEHAAKIKQRGLRPGSVAVDVLQARSLSLDAACVVAAACDLSLFFVRESVAVGGRWGAADSQPKVFEHAGGPNYVLVSTNADQYLSSKIAVTDVAKPMKGISTYSAKELKEMCARLVPPPAAPNKRAAYDAITAHISSALAHSGGKNAKAKGRPKLN
jgi:hypothetical protein